MLTVFSLKRFCNPYPGRIESGLWYSENTIKEVIVMKEKIAKEFVSILMESPFYLMLRLRERHSLLTRLLKIHGMNKHHRMIK
jgi:hypothetical protein